MNVGLFKDWERHAEIRAGHGRECVHVRVCVFVHLYLYTGVCVCVRVCGAHMCVLCTWCDTCVVRECVCTRSVICCSPIRGLWLRSSSECREGRQPGLRSVATND